MKLALVQLEVEPWAVRENVSRARERIADAASDGADVVALPELFTVGYFSFDRYARSAQALDGETLTLLAETAREHDVGVLAGSLVEDLEASAAAGFETPAPDGLANTAVYIDAGGQRRAVYRKQHLFGYDSAERELLTPGESLPTVEVGEHVVGVTTCYDLRFPELYRRLVEKGVTLVLVPSAWPYPRVEHWTLLPRARAVENLWYVGAVNGVGSFADAELLGRSAVYDPWGMPVAATGDRPDLVTATVDRERVETVRDEFPALADRRF